MEYRRMDNLGIDTSVLGFGCMRLPLDADGNINYSEAEQMVDRAYQSGVNYFDTAYVYHGGDSENFTGKVLDKYDRSSYYIATKLPCWLVNEKEDAKRLLEEQLSKLNKDYIDFYLLHALNRESFNKMAELGVLDLMDQMKEEGKIKHFGFSFHDDYEVFSYILNYRKWDFCQIQLNYMDTELQAGMKGYELTEKLGIPLVIMEPIKGGLLANLTTDFTKYFDEVTANKSAASWAMRWVASLPNVKVVLSGMSDEKQVIDNLNTFENFQPLNEKELEAVDKVKAEIREKMKIGCTGCSYCMPCPAGVNIPYNFRIWNEYGMYRNTGHTQYGWNIDIGEGAKAKNCISCGNCESHCPQKLDIREKLKQLQSELDVAVL